jgi:hypothetical protein
LDVFARDPRDTLVHARFDGSGWRGWEDLGYAMQDDPAAVSWGDGRIDVEYRGVNGKLHTANYRRGFGWTGVPRDLGFARGPAVATAPTSTGEHLTAAPVLPRSWFT